MLLSLHIKNLALIDEAEVEFGEGLNILTGETGAGKSILLGSVNLALGRKVPKELVKEGGDTTLVELLFHVDSAGTLEKLSQLGVEAEDGDLVISRKIREGRSVIRVNGETTSAGTVRSIASLLLDIHGQHDHQSLLYPDKQLEILDAYGGEPVRHAAEQTADAYGRYREARNTLKKYQMNTDERLREISFLEFEIREISDAEIIPGEDEQLEAEYRRMSNGKQIMESLQAVSSMTSSDSGAGESSGRALRLLLSALPMDPALQPLCDTLGDVDNLLADFNRDLSSYMADFTFSDEDYYRTGRRLDLLNNLKAKYGKTLEDVQRSLEEKQKRLDMLTDFENGAELAEQKCRETEQLLAEKCAALSSLRRKTAAALEGSVRKALADLNFAQTDFQIALDPDGAYTPNGCDTAAFLISTNPGEPVKPLAKIASGGELSRIMLAIRSLMADKESKETLIFDEIDAGISGRTAQKVSEKMTEISKNHQVICITHLPQIAAMADSHFEILKQVENNMSRTRIRLLCREDSVKELARILSGAEVTGTVYENAREMKTLADCRKEEIRRKEANVT